MKAALSSTMPPNSCDPTGASARFVMMNEALDMLARLGPHVTRRSGVVNGDTPSGPAV